MNRGFSLIILSLFCSGFLLYDFEVQNQNSEGMIRAQIENPPLIEPEMKKTLYSKNSQIPTSVQLQMSSYLGGNGNDIMSFMEIDLINNIYLAGSTNSPDFPLSNPLISFLGENSGFLVKINNQENISFSTYIGGSGFDYIICMTIDTDDNVYFVKKLTN